MLSQASLLLAISFISHSALANPIHQPNLVDDQMLANEQGQSWGFELHNDAKLIHPHVYSGELCLQYQSSFQNPLPSQDEYKWCLFNWSGVATKEGDQVFMHSNDPNNQLFSGIQWSLSSKDEGAGHWRYWQQPSGLMLDMNAIFTRTQKTCSCP